VITGPTSGVGYEAALALADLGARLVLVARNPERAAATADAVAARTGDRDVPVVLGDLSSQAEVRRVAEELLRLGEPVHVLLNNAGGVFGFRRSLSVDGVEMTMALNHLALHTLTLLLLPLLRASAPARVVNVASDAYKGAGGRLDCDDYSAERGYRPIRQYGRSKLAVILFTRELARRVEGTGVTVNACTPPRLTATRFAHNVHPLAEVALKVASPFVMSAPKGAQSLVHLCASPDVAELSGTYWSGLRRPPLADEACNDEDAARLWDLAVQLTGVDLQET
jgi:NAD(P)-dependent dehydrogenase (short-subunit alcohol dehydrogenase family)